MASTAADLQKLNEANNQFTKSIYNVLRETEKGNIFFSPLSIEAVLSVVHAGAKGNTATQIQKSTFLDDDPKLNGGLFKSLSDEINAANENITLNFVNGLYSDAKFPINPQFLDLVKNVYQAEMNQVDFQKNPTAAEQTINSWVAEKTNNKIPELLSKGSVTALTRLVLLNAIYFKGEWLKKFPVSATQKKTFHLNKKESKEVDFMTVKAHFKINILDDCTVIALPYQGESVSLILIVPKDIEGLSAIESKYVGSDVGKILKDSRKEEVILTMPKFKLEQTLDLISILQKLGVTDLFSRDDSDLSGIADDLFVSKAVQKAYINVDEQGSEAAAATAMVARFKRALLEADPERVTVDRPFLFFLHTSNDIQLFLGAIRQPESSAVEARHEEL